MDVDEKQFDFYAKLWGLEKIEKIAETHTSDVYKVKKFDSIYVLKILNEKGAIYEKSSVESLKSFNGIGAVRLIENTETTLLLEYVDGVKLSTLCKKLEDKSATEIICNIVSDLQERKKPSTKFHGMEEQFRSLFKMAKELSDAHCFYSKAADIAKELISTEGKVKLLHGDIHHDNILYSSKRGWLSIDPQSFYGELTYDLCNSFYNPDDTPDLVEQKNRICMMAEVYSEFFKIDKQRILKFAYAFGGLSSVWQIEDGERPERRPRIASLIGNLIGV